MTGMTTKLVKPQISLRAALDDPELLGTALAGQFMARVAFYASFNNRRAV